MWTLITLTGLVVVVYLGYRILRILFHINPLLGAGGLLIMCLLIMCQA